VHGHRLAPKQSAVALQTLNVNAAAGLSQLNAAGLGDVYVRTQTDDAGEYCAPADDYGDYEPDNNEPV
jgi:hypothetical protein